MWPTVRKASKGEDVRSAQYLLAAQGQPGDADGVFGAGTEDRVRVFQTSKGLGADGVVGSQTWPALIMQVAQGSTGDAVRAVQSQLNHYRPGFLTVDGSFGPQTDDAVRRFQTKNGLVSDGIVGPMTWETLVGGGRLSLEPEETAVHLFQAWTQADPGSARQVATEDAVMTLFARPWRAADGWTLQRSEGAAGHLYVVWGGAGEELALGVLTMNETNENIVDQVLLRSLEGGM
ncbi:MAG: peptidoglycan-binding domain-containing protein [Acidimicrobiales bacterium]